MGPRQRCIRNWLNCTPGTELVHGYGLGSFDPSDCEERNAGGNCAVFNNLRGSGMVVGNIEVRAPLIGLLKGEIDYGRVPIEIAGFFDAGLCLVQR